MQKFLFPRYSFIQNAADTGGCYPDAESCLPISSPRNLKFEFYIYSDEIGLGYRLTSGFIYLVPVPLDYDCSDHTLPSIASLVLPHMLYATHVTVDYGGSSTSFTAHGYFDSPGYEFDQIVEEAAVPPYYPHVGECFRFMVLNQVSGMSTMRVLGCIGCFRRIAPDSCYSSVLTYACDEDAFDFKYLRTPGPQFENKIELPIYLRDPEMHDDSKVYTRSDGTVIKLYERKEEQYILQSDMMSYTRLKALDIALSHDTVFITNSNMKAYDSINTATQFVKKDNFEIEYQKGPLTAFGQGSCKLINATPVHLYNNNCR